MSFRKVRYFTQNEKKFLMCLMLSAIMMLMTGFTTRNINNVRITVDGRTIETYSTEVSPARILRREGVTLNKKDEYQLRKTENCTEITVRRAVPVKVEYKGRRREILTSRPNVEETLKELGYQVENYEVAPGLDSTIHENIDIVLTDSAAKIAAEQAAELAAQQEKQIQTSRGMARYQAVMTMEATAYIPSDGGGNGITASGMMAQRGVVAVDPNVIPLGTRLYIPGYGEAIAADTGGAIIGARIDLCMETYWEAMQFGRRDVTVYVLN